jgi:hypothetical protein
MKLDPGMHIVMHLVFFRKVGVTISRWVDWSIGCSVGSGISRLHYFVFASSIFSHRVKGTLDTTSLARTLRSASGI